MQIRNYKLSSKQNEIKQFEVVSTAVKNKDYYLENLKKKSSASIDYISSETMKKTGDNNVTAAIGGANYPTTEEVRNLVSYNFSAQKRAVTVNDYESIIPIGDFAANVIRTEVIVNNYNNYN